MRNNFATTIPNFWSENFGNWRSYYCRIFGTENHNFQCCIRKTETISLWLYWAVSLAISPRDFTHWSMCRPIPLTFLAEPVPELIHCFLLCSPYALSHCLASSSLSMWSRFFVCVTRARQSPGFVRKFTKKTAKITLAQHLFYLIADVQTSKIKWKQNSIYLFYFILFYCMCRRCKRCPLERTCDVLHQLFYSVYQITGPLRLIWHNFTNSQHSLIILGT